MNDYVDPHGFQAPTLDVRVVAQPNRKAVYRTVFSTITLISTAEPKQLLAESDDRVCAYLVAMDDDVCIAGNRNEAQAGTGAILAKRLTAPHPVQTSAALWVCAPTLAAATSRVSVVDIHCTYADQ